jgi:CRISPR-associated protein Csy1
MNNNGITKEFVKLLDSYKIEKIKKLVKEIGDTFDKDIEIGNEKYLFNKQEIQWSGSFLLELEKWEKFKKDKSFTEKKLKDRISKSIKESLGNGELSIDVVKKLKNLKASLNLQSISSSEINTEIVKKWIKSAKKIEKEYAYDRWLDWASINAKNISFSTHVAKLTHSSIKGATNIYFDKSNKEPYYFSTSSLAKKTVDISQTDNKLAPVGKLLQLEFNGIKLADKMRNRDLSDFKFFAKSEEQLLLWEENFFNAFQSTKPSSHFLAKQMYFPISKDTYHMLSPLVSSSLEQEVYEKIQHSKYKKSKKNREQKKAGKYHQDINVWYPNLAILKVTQSYHGNASPLNGKRGGLRYLFPSTSPQWKSSIKPPLKYVSLFRDYERRAWKQTKELQEYLLKITDNKPNMYIRDNVRRNINWIIDTLFNYVAEIQNLKELRGWSQKEGKLKESHRLWLDPYCEDIEFQSKRETKEWQDEVCLDFGLWLNKKLEHKEMLFVKINSDRWAKILKGRLREFERDLEVLR